MHGRFLENRVSRTAAGRTQDVHPPHPAARSRVPSFVRAQDRYVPPYAAHPERRGQLVEGRTATQGASSGGPDAVLPRPATK